MAPESFQQVNVDSDILDPETATTMITITNERAEGGHMTNDVTTSEVEIEFEMLDMSERNPPKVSQTATPNNTPMGKRWFIINGRNKRIDLLKELRYRGWGNCLRGIASEKKLKYGVIRV